MPVGLRLSHWKQRLMSVAIWDIADKIRFCSVMAENKGEKYIGTKLCQVTVPPGNHTIKGYT